MKNIQIFQFAGGLWGVILFAGVFFLIDEPKVAIFISIFVVFVVTALLVKFFGFFDPRALFSVTALPYIVAAPFDLYFFNNSNDFDDRSIAWLSFASAIFIASYLVAVFINKPSFKNRKLIILPKFSAKVITFLFVASFFSYVALVKVFFSLDFGLSRSDLYSNKPVIYDVFKLANQVLIVFMIWYSVFVNKTSSFHMRIGFFCLLCLMAVDVLFMGDRRMAVVMLLIVGYFVATRWGVSKKQWLGLMLLAVGMLLYGGFRNMPLDIWMDIYTDLDFFKFLNPANLEFGAFPKIWQDYFSKWNYEIEPTYWAAPIQLVPSFLFPERPLPPSVKFVQEFYPDLAAMGGGLAFNAILESVMNFSFAGPMVSGFLIGIGFARSLNVDARLRLVVGSVLIYAFSFFMRTDFVSALRFLVLSSFIMMILMKIFCRVQYK